MNLDLLVKDPIVRGALALFPVFSDVPSAAQYLTGPDAEAAGVLRVSERDGGAAVPELVVHNTSRQPLLLLEGETVVGAKQNRTLNVSVLVPAGSKLAVPVSCVEAGRWGAPRGAARSTRHAPGDLRRVNAGNVAASRRAGAGARGNQGAVWDRVAAYQTDLAAPSATSAMEDVYRRVEPDLRSMVAELTPLPDQRGVIVAVGGQVRGLDWFDKASTLAAYWPSLVQGYALDALRAPAGEAPTIADAEAFVGRALAADITSEPAVGLGRDRTLGGNGIVGHALEWDGVIVHLAAFVTDDGRVPDRPATGRTRHTQSIDRRRWFGG